MSQHDLTIDNQGFPAFRADLNNALQALGSTQSGTTAPSPTFANQLWYDTTNNILKIRNEDNDAWISLLTLDQVADAVSVITGSTINAGALTASGNVSFDGGTFVFNDSGADKDFRIEGDTNANLFFTDASTDRVGIGTNTPAGLLGIGTEGTYLASNVIRFSPSGDAYIDHETTGQNLNFRVSNAGTLDTTPLTLTSAGVLDIPFGQIKFPATQNASANANTLDDYEEGTFTPTIATTGSAFSSVTYVTQSGKYTKIGDTVFISLKVSWSAASGGSGDVRIGGLPFSAGDGFTSMAMYQFFNVVSDLDFQMRTNSNTQLAPQYLKGSSGVNVINFNSGSFDKSISCSGCYKIN
jgi:hypothetical protein